MSRCRHVRRLIAAIAIACGAWVSIAVPAGATGASTIATASELPLGSLVVGGGQPIDFYRLELSAGDQIDIVYDMLNQPNCGYLYLFDPTVTDFNLAEAKAVSGVNVGPGQQSVMLTSSFNGLGTFAVAIDGPNNSSCVAIHLCRLLSASAQWSPPSASRRRSSISRRSPLDPCQATSAARDDVYVYKRTFNLPQEHR